MILRIALAILLLALTACSSSTPSTTSPTRGTSVSIVSGSSNLTTTAYAPNPVSVPVGGTVTWMNNDSVAHNSVSNTGVWNSSTIAPGGTYSYTFPTAGSFSYHCSIHPGMVGTVTVQ
ncbi:MAG TPA: plastocyanin/azurin family copper-binding protein [Vicinamibacterales bacterium]|nr:plastocyanin/azurin family copper-binding protein [Vicinamibacterales bacterium]